MQCETINSTYPIIFIIKNFISLFFLFYFIFRKNFVVKSVHEQCPNSDSKTVPSPKTGQVHNVQSQLTQPADPASMPRCAQASAHSTHWRCVVGTPCPCRGMGRSCHGLVPRPSRRPGGNVVAECRAQARPCRGPVSRHSPASSPPA